MVSLTLWPVVTVFSLVAISFLLAHPAIEFIVRGGALRDLTAMQERF